MFFNWLTWINQSRSPKRWFWLVNFKVQYCVVWQSTWNLLYMRHIFQQPLNQPLHITVSNTFWVVHGLPVCATSIHKCEQRIEKDGKACIEKFWWSEGGFEPWLNVTFMALRRCCRHGCSACSLADLQVWLFLKMARRFFASLAGIILSLALTTDLMGRWLHILPPYTLGAL